MNKIYIITAGCSFTDGFFKYRDSEKVTNNWRNDWFKELPYYAVNTTLKYNNFLSLDLIYNKIDFKIINVGAGSAGNHIIAQNYKNAVKKLLDRGIDPNNIIGTIQLSGLVRHRIDYPPFYWYDGLKIDYNYTNKNQNEFDYKFIFENQIQNIKSLIDFNLNNGITKFKMFFGWAIFFKNELEKYGEYKNFIQLNNKYLDYFKYNENWDKQEWVCAGTKNVLKALKELTKESYLIDADEFGGMTELLRDKFTDKNAYYISKHDAHLNSFGNYHYYKERYRNWFIDWGILNDENPFEKDFELKYYLKSIFELNEEQYSIFTEHKISDQSPPFISIYLRKYYEEKLSKNKTKYLY